MEAAQSELSEGILQCPACSGRLQVGRQVDTVEERCPVCRSQVTMRVFPRFYRGYASEEKAIVAADDEARCAFFPELRAEKVCDECGCFMSSRATVNWGGRDTCMPCLYRLREVRKSPEYAGKASLHDRRALAMVTWLAPFTLFTAPIALFVLLRYRNEPAGFVPRKRVVWWIAFVLASGWLFAWLVMLMVWLALFREDFS